MRYVIRAIVWADGGACAFSGQYLQAFDPQDSGGLDTVIFTPEHTKAKTFQTSTAALEFWRTQSHSVPVRPDGKPNRPLTAITVEIFDLDQEQQRDTGRPVH